jgi:hypothetical protein
MCRAIDPTSTLAVLDYPFENSGEMLNMIRISSITYYIVIA